MVAGSPQVSRRWRFVALILAAASPSVSLEISLTQPPARHGDAITSDASQLRLEGEVVGGVQVRDVTVNGEPAGVGTRDLVLEGLEDEGVPFRSIVQLQAGQNTIEIRAADAGGETAVLQLTVTVDPGSLSGEVYALIVGVNDYRDRHIGDLRFAESDAAAIQAALTDPQSGIVRPENVVTLTGAQATYRNISRALEEHLVRRARRPQDVVVFYFAGHGAEGPHVSRGAAYYLVPQDAKLTNLLSTGIDKGRLQFLWGAIPAHRKVFITDACHSGGLQSMKVLSADGLETVEGYITMAAARADQLALELPQLGHGLFTYALTQGMRGGADEDGDGWVSAQELGAYVGGRVQQMAAELGSEQIPVVELAPGADLTPVATSDARPLPAWQPPPPPPSQPYLGLIKVTLRFEENAREPHMILAVRDEEGDEDLGQVTATAIMARLLSQEAPFHLLEPSAVADELRPDQMALAYSDDPADIAAVARAVEADLMLTGHFRTQAAVLDEEMRELLGASMQSYQAHLSVRVVSAHTGEVVQAKSVQQGATHINPVMAQRLALEKAGRRLADGLHTTLARKWETLMAVRPNGMAVAENVEDIRMLGRLEDGLAALQPAVTGLTWQSFEEGSALYSFRTSAGGDPLAVAERLRQAGLPGLRVGGIRAGNGTVSFWVK